MNDERLTGLIAHLRTHHRGGFVNQIIMRDELLAVLEELQALRKRLGREMMTSGAGGLL